LAEEIRRRLRIANVELVAVLNAEPLYEASHFSFGPRIAAETLVRLVAAEEGVYAEMLSRATVRSLLGLPVGGKLQERVAEAVPEPVGPYWRAGRDLAALAALAIAKRK